MDQASEVYYGLNAERWKSVVNTELRQSIGYMQNGAIEGERVTALKAIQGDSDVPHLDGRSSVNDTAIAEAIDTIMPDLLEIFTGGEDVAAFDPVGPEDEELAEQETRTVVHLVMEKNPGVELIHDYCYDALSLKTGVFKVTWQDKEEVTRQDLNDVSPEQVDLLMAQGEEIEQSEEGFQRISRIKNSCPVIEVVAPEDFGVAPDTKELRDATYCVMRTRTRAQVLIKDGLPADKVMLLQEGQDTDTVGDARDTVEQDEDATIDAAVNGLKRVEVHEHYIRFDPEGGDNLRIYQVLTDYSCQVLLSVEEVDVIPFAAGTPYRLPHRFYGGSLADKLLEVQRIKTSLLRTMLDDGYFGVNNRLEVNVNKMTKSTIKDLLDNRPGRPVFTEGEALSPIQSRGLSYDTVGAIEMVDVIGERRSGVVRNAQGLNPDTLHDTAKGAQMLVSAAQKRVRLIARMLAQGIRDMYLLVHRMTRTNGKNISMRVNEGEFIQVDPSEWQFRSDATIRIAVGSGGREEKLAMLTNVVDRQAEAIQMQGGVEGPLVNAQNVHRALTDLMKVAGLPEDAYFMDPAQYEAPDPQPDPEVIKQENDAAIQREKIASEERQAAAKLQAEDRQFNQRLAMERDLGIMKMRLDAISGQNQSNFRPGGSVAA